MRTVTDPPDALGDGLAAIRAEYGVPTGFPPAVLAAAAEAAARPVPGVRTGPERRL